MKRWVFMGSLDASSEKKALVRAKKLAHELSKVRRSIGPVAGIKVSQTHLSLNPCLRNPGFFKNDEDSAGALYEDFHGRPSETVEEVHYEQFEQEDVAQLGDLIELQVYTPFGKMAIIKAPDPSEVDRLEVIRLTASPDRKQLYFVGGDQRIDVGSMGFEDADVKHKMFLGVLAQLTYQTKKGFHDFKLTDYFHDLGEESGLQPILVYDPLSPLMEVAGGRYEIKDVGIVD